MRLPLKLLLLAVLLSLLGLAVAWPRPWQMPIRSGTAESFWAAATGVRKENGFGNPSWCLPYDIDGWFLYTSDHFHGSAFFRVAAVDVIANCPNAEEELVSDPKFVQEEWGKEGFRGWEKADPEHANPRLFLQHLRASRLNWWIKNHPERLNRPTERDYDLAIASQRMSLFPLMQIAEWAYFSALILFVAWPWLRNRGRWAWAIHVALLPPLLMLPYYLGYCMWNYTSAGPCGGVVYPFILDLFRPLPWTTLDREIVIRIPHILAPLTGPLGPMLSLSGGGGAGPVGVVCLGLGLGVVVFGLGTILKKIIPSKG
jgi:hypothetical protein